MAVLRRWYQQITGRWQRAQVERFLGQLTLLLLTTVFLLVSTLLVAFDAFSGDEDALALAVGQVAAEDVLSPISMSYESDVLTAQRRDLAQNSVLDVYDPPNPSIARQQVQQARQILDFIADVRGDEFADETQLQVDLQAISGITLDEQAISVVLNASSSEWADIDQEVIIVIERVMRAEIRDDSLRTTKQNIPNLVSVRFDEDEVALITAIIVDLVQTNTFFNEERTESARLAASEAVTPEVRSFEQGQIVVRAGMLVTDADLEALSQLGLQQPIDNSRQAIMSAFILSFLLVTIFALYVNRFFPRIFYDVTLMILLGVIFLVVLAGVRMSGPDRIVQPFIFSAASLGLFFTTLAGPQIAIMGIIAMAMLIGAMTGTMYLLVVMVLLGGIVGILVLRNTERMNNYFVAGIAIGLTNAVVVLAGYLTGYPTDPRGALTLVGAGLVNGLLAGVITLAGLYLISNVLNIPTSLRLTELTQPNQRLLQRLLREAPGTYQHSLQVANLAEVAAEHIGANPILTRVGALYHDVGKMNAPHFFIENQLDSINPHDMLDDPYRSAEIILDHVIEGEKLGRRYRLPARVRDFILEHHGTTMPMYFYRKAAEKAAETGDEVDKMLFTYPGPRPQSKETAILMLADGCESAVRARQPENKTAIAETVRYIFDTRMDEGQLDESGLTLRDLSQIQDVFVETLQGMFHSRISYTKAPQQDEAPPVEVEETAGLPATEPAINSVPVVEEEPEAEPEPAVVSAPSSVKKLAPPSGRAPTVVHLESVDEDLAISDTIEEGDNPLKLTK